MDTKPFTLVICPSCGTVLGLDKNNNDLGINCPSCSNGFQIKEAFRLGMKEMDDGTNVWMGVRG